MGKKCTRKQLLVNRKFQLAFVAKFVVFYIIIFSIFFFVMDLFVESEAEAIAKSFATHELIQEKFRLIIIVISIISIVVSSLLLGFFVMALSHRIAGPLHRFDNALKELADRKLNASTKLREKDQLFGISDSMTLLKEELRVDFSEMKDICEAQRKRTDIELSENMKRLIVIIDQYEL